MAMTMGRPGGAHAAAEGTATQSSARKRTLAVSIAVLLLCLVALIGTTFAWFTSTASNTGNRIQAGNLQVKLLMDETAATTGAAGASYTDISNKTSGDIFNTAEIAKNSNATLWEPGKTQIVYLAVENAGNLDLKYSIGIDVSDVSGSASMVQDGVSALEYAILDKAKSGDSDKGISALQNKTWSELKASATSSGDVTIGSVTAAPDGSLTKGSTDYFALAVHMKEDAGNAFKSAAANIDVTVAATQKASENDGFGTNTYDAASSYVSDCLTFSSETSEFTITADEKRWNGTLYYSQNGVTWKEWTGSAITSSGKKLYLRGTDNTRITGDTGGTSNPITCSMATSGATLQCSGDIMDLLDYTKDVTMASNAFNNLFNGWSCLTTAPTLSATVLADKCYRLMFAYTGITVAPDLPATSLPTWCYIEMFKGSAVSQLPVMSATSYGNASCQRMFQSCSNLKLSSTDQGKGSWTLPSGSVGDNALNGMFENVGEFPVAGGTPVMGATYYYK